MTGNENAERVVGNCIRLCFCKWEGKEGVLLKDFVAFNISAKREESLV